MTIQPRPVSTTEIADLLAWCRRLSDAGAEPGERAAYLAAKADLLARIADERAATWSCEHTEARRAASQARTVADQAAALQTHTGPAQEEL